MVVAALYSIGILSCMIERGFLEDLEVGFRPGQGSMMKEEGRIGKDIYDWLLLYVGFGSPSTFPFSPLKPCGVSLGSKG